MYRLYSRLIASLMLVLMASPVSASITVQNWAQAQNQQGTGSTKISVSYTPTAAPDVVIVWCTAYNDYNSGGDAFTATYGGASNPMTKIAVAEDTAGEEGEVIMFYLLNPPSGTQTAECDGTSWKTTNGSGKAVSVVVTSLTTTFSSFKVPGSGVAENDQDDPSVSNIFTTSGSFRVLGGLYSGRGDGSALSAGSGMTLNHSASNNTCATGTCDVGARLFATTYSSSDQTSSGSCQIVTDLSDDVAMVCAAFEEIKDRRIWLTQ